MSVPAGSYTEAANPADGLREAHVLVCVAGAEDDLRLIRHGALLAERVHARLSVLYVLSPSSGRRPSNTLQADRLFARSVGAPLVEMPAGSVVDGIAGYAVERGATHLVLSEEQRTPWYASRHGSLVDSLVARLAGIEIYVLGGASFDVRA
jgi:two-component system sensor histidine kinase KdpD